PSAILPHSAASSPQVRGIQSSPASVSLGHRPQSSVAPQPSLARPHCTPSPSQVWGTHAPASSPSSGTLLSLGSVTGASASTFVLASCSGPVGSVTSLAVSSVVLASAASDVSGPSSPHAQTAHPRANPTTARTLFGS